MSIIIHEKWCTHFVQELQGFKPNDREDVFMFYASALQSLQYFYQTQVQSLLPSPCDHDVLDAFKKILDRFIRKILLYDYDFWQFSINPWYMRVDGENAKSHNYLAKVCI